MYNNINKIKNVNKPIINGQENCPCYVTSDDM